MPTSTRGDYRRFIDGVNLTKDKRVKIIEQIRNVLAKHYTSEAIEWEFE